MNTKLQATARLKAASTDEVQHKWLLPLAKLLRAQAPGLNLVKSYLDEDGNQYAKMRARAFFVGEDYLEEDAALDKFLEANKLQLKVAVLEGNLEITICT